MTDVETCSVAVEGVSLEDRGSSSPAPQGNDVRDCTDQHAVSTRCRWLPICPSLNPRVSSSA